ncbi:MAG: hypothetical protein Q7J16_10670 [Candidatus Cloacimonadales bacterium]|nr:hypothetical protein [Candidatus Cloacimonadales bacterium]
MITIQSKPYSDNELKEKPEKVNENGDSLFTAVIEISNGDRGGSNIIRSLGNYIILIKLENKRNVAVMSLKLTESNLELLQKIEQYGMESVILKPPENNNK